MINFNYETDFKLLNEEHLVSWIKSVIELEQKKEGQINYIFCDDQYLLKINREYLKHDTYTDIISFDYTVGKELHGDVFISIERVKENALKFKVDFNNELARVMVHGVLHYCGYKDKSEKDKLIMRDKENFYLKHYMGIQ